MKTVSKSRSQKTNTSRKAGVKLTLKLTAEQAERLDVIAKMVSATPETLAISQIFSGFDGWSSWGEFTEAIHDQISLYAESSTVSYEEPGKRLEDDAPERIKRMAAYVSPVVVSAQEVAHA
jgi:hypothetical protein